MEDEKITELLTNRDQSGLAALKAKYSRLILKVCRGFLRSPEDAEECANDTLLAVWEKIPPDRPENLAAYICKIARRRAVDKLRYNTAAMRSTELMTELDECLPSRYSTEDEAEKAELSAALNEWLKSLDERRRRLFTLRYFYMRSAKDAAKACSMTPTAATTALARLRASLKQYLIERGLFYE
ncbi:MAG: sigma-70 family RNA polymerase sigma factor [Lachnospiraceae bacterium]|nr:sigma-70 family RNA polymerase sigma factor [Ruminococcus sp.]MCM1273874.1 sigma-70 family RNA polymerase sigma factor [Lachnospiraceae bacterium]